MGINPGPSRAFGEVHHYQKGTLAVSNIRNIIQLSKPVNTSNSL
jgi:hypothetical protein